MRVYLIRHGQTAWNAGRKAQGHTDIPLDEQGIEQAQLLVSAFANQPVARILSSDLQRTLMTAQPLAESFRIEIEPRTDLRERSFGEWEGLPFEQIAQRFIEQELLTGVPKEEIRPPGGESLLDVWHRLKAVDEELNQVHEPTVVVTHGGTCGLLLARLLSGSFLTSRSFRFDNTGVTTIARRPDTGFHLIGYNDSSHLRQPALSGSVDGTIRA